MLNSVQRFAAFARLTLMYLAAMVLLFFINLLALAFVLAAVGHLSDYPDPLHLTSAVLFASVICLELWVGFKAVGRSK